MTPTKEETILTVEDLAQFTGTETYWRLSHLYPFLCTDGVHFLAQRGSAFWLLDAITSWQAEPNVKNDSMLKNTQFWTLIVKADQSAVLTCERDKGDVVVTQEIAWTDFPLPSVKLYLCNMECFWDFDKTGNIRRTSDYGVLLLPSEY